MPAKDEIGRSIKDKWYPALAEICGAYVDPKLFVVTAIDAINRMEKPCTQTSVLKTVFNGASMGLLFGSAMRQMYIVPFKNKALSKREDRDVFDAQLVVGYPGYTELAFRNRFLKSLTTDVVLKGEEFKHWVDEDGRHIRHDPLPERPPATRDNVLLSYMVYQTIDGGRGVFIVQKSGIEKAYKDYSDAWKYDYAAMARKVPIVRGAKSEWRLSQLTQLATAIRLDEQEERGEPQDNLSGRLLTVDQNGTGDHLTLEAPREPADEPKGRESAEYAEYERKQIEAEQHAESLF